MEVDVKLKKRPSDFECKNCSDGDYKVYIDKDNCDYVCNFCIVDYYSC